MLCKATKVLKRRGGGAPGVHALSSYHLDLPLKWPLFVNSCPEIRRCLKQFKVSLILFYVESIANYMPPVTSGLSELLELSDVDSVLNAITSLFLRPPNRATALLTKFLILLALSLSS